MVKFISKARVLAEMGGEPEVWGFEPKSDIRTVMREMGEGNVIGEFIGTGDFAAAFHERRSYEVKAGRDMEPLLYPSFYRVVEDPSIQETETIYRLGPGKVVFEEIREGGEVKWVTIDSDSVSITQRQFGFGIRYSKRFFKFNRLWQLSIVERQAGTAYNALLNHIHINPILTATLTGNNATDGTALTTFKTTASMPEKYLRTLEAAIQSSKTDTTNPRKGPYDLLVSSGDEFTVERALNPVPQQGFSLQSGAMGMIDNVLVYDGWTGSRGIGSETTYAGVSTGTGYLVHKGHRDEDFLSLVSQSLEMTMGNPDISRFIMEQQAWDTFFGQYANPIGAVQKITWPTADSGDS